MRKHDVVMRNIADRTMRKLESPQRDTATPKDLMNAAASIRYLFSEISIEASGKQAMRQALRRVARLNPDAGEIGDGMLHTIVAEAKEALQSADD